MKVRTLFSILFTILIIISSCSTFQLKVASDKNVQNVPDLGIDWNYSAIVNQVYRPKLDSAINVLIGEFNRQKHNFTVHKKNPGDKNYITLDFTKGKIPTAGAKAAGYIVTGLGLIVVPVAVVAASGGTAFVAFYYVPLNVVVASASLSPDMSDRKSLASPVGAANGALFANSNKQVNKVISKFSLQLTSVLLNVDKQLAKHR